MLAQPFSAIFSGRPLSQATLNRAIGTFQPNLVVIHKAERLFELGLETTPVPVVAMIHDHDWICIRRHRYLPITHTVCERKASVMACFACGLAVERNRGVLPIRYRPVWHRTRDADTLRKIAGVWVASDYMNQELVRHGVDAKRITTIPLGVPDKPVQATQGTAGTVVYVGQILRTKGLDVLLRAMARQSCVKKLDIVGGGHQREEFEDLAKRLGVFPKTTWHGKQSPDRVASLLSAAAVVVMPHRWPEPFGLVGLEAMRAARPVITSDAGGVRTWLVPGMTGLLTRPGDVSELGRALESLLTQTEVCKTMGIAARDRFDRYFTLERFLDCLEQAIGQVTETPRRARCI